MNYLLIGKYRNSTISALVLRKGNVENIQVHIYPLSTKTPSHTEGLLPRYLIFGGLVMIPLTIQYILDYKSGSNRVGLSTFAKASQKNFATCDEEEHIVLSRVFSSDISKGVNLSNVILNKINNIKIKSLTHLNDILNTFQDNDLLKFEFTNTSRILIIKYKEAIIANEKVLSRNLIKHPRSQELQVGAILK